MKGSLNAGRGFRPVIPDSRCSDKCLKYKAKQEWGVSRYANGQKYCTICRVYVKFDGTLCPCCKSELRTSPAFKIHKTNQ
jgi:ferredoxin